MPNYTILIEKLLEIFITANIYLTAPTQKLLAHIGAVLLQGTDAGISALADTLPNQGASRGTREQQIRRFLDIERVTPHVFLPVLLILIRPLCELLPELVLSIDRTEWKKRGKWVNVLMVSLTFEGRGIPLYWKVGDRRGNSSLADQKEVLAPVIEALQSCPWTASKTIIVTGDREFSSPDLPEWLSTTYSVESVIRIKRSQYLTDGSVNEKLANLLAYFAQGKTQHFPQVGITKISPFLMNVTITWGDEYEEPLIIASTLDHSTESLETFKKRFHIEPMFKDSKSNGFNIEKTRVTDPKRIEALWVPMSIAHALCMVEGCRKEKSGEVKPHKANGKVIRAVGLFLVGLRSFTNHTNHQCRRVCRKFYNRTIKIVNCQIPLKV